MLSEQMSNGLDNAGGIEGNGREFEECWPSNRVGVLVSDVERPEPPVPNINTPEAVFEAVEKLKFYLSCEAELYLNIGKILTILTEKKRYRLYGSHIQTKDDFLKEVGLKRSTAYVYMDVWRTFGKHLESTKLTVPYRRLIEALPVARTEEEAIEWIHKAEALLPTDYKAEVHKAKTGVDDLTCDHSETELYAKCLKCGKWLKS